MKTGDGKAEGRVGDEERRGYGDEGRGCSPSSGGKGEVLSKEAANVDSVRSAHGFYTL